MPSYRSQPGSDRQNEVSKTWREGEKVSGLPFRFQWKRHTLVQSEGFPFFFFLNGNGFRLQVRDAVCLILVWTVGFLYYFARARREGLMACV